MSTKLSSKESAKAVQKVATKAVQKRVMKAVQKRSAKATSRASTKPLSSTKALSKGSSKNNPLKQDRRGGYRAGSGRPKGSGKYKEATKPMRIPQTLVSEVQSLLSFYVEGIDQQKMEWQGVHQNIFRPEFRKTSTCFPLYATRVAAGFPSPADDYIEAKLDLNQYLVKHPAATFFVRVEGDSMIGAGIHPDDILVVDRSLKPSDGRIVIAVINGELTVKRLKMEAEGLKLIAENPRYRPIHITEEMNFSIWGVVTSVIHGV